MVSTKFFIRMTCLLALLSILSILPQAQALAQEKVYVIDIKQNIDKSAVRRLNLGIKEAADLDADYIVIHLDTYGGAVDAADSMRKAILQCDIPVIAFIDLQAASAGALISIACDSIYMRTGASIGAATVVNQNGEVMPDKYQSFMRGMMRSTAESHGKKTIVRNGDTLEVWHRDPKIAEQMVDTANVLSFTPKEAISNRFCEGMAETVEEVAATVAGKECEIIRQHISKIDSFILKMLSPILQSLFLMMIIGGIYFEIQSPGLGFPSVIAVLGAILYFSPLYIHGLAMNWEIVVFILGLILIGVEIFITPGFGVAGVTGILLSLTGLIFAMVDNTVLYREGNINLLPLLKPCAIVIFSTLTALILSIWGASRLYPSTAFSAIAQKTELKGSEGWVGVETDKLAAMNGKTVTAATSMCPTGKVQDGENQYDATMEYGSADAGETLKVIRTEGGRLYCIHSDGQTR